MIVGVVVRIRTAHKRNGGTVVHTTHLFRCILSEIDFHTSKWDVLMAEDKNFAFHFFQNSRERNFDRLIDKFNVLNLGHYIAAVPSDTPDEIVKGIFAVITAYTLNLKSLDYVIRKFGEGWDEKIEESKKRPNVFDEISEFIQKEIVEIVQWVNGIDEKPDIFGLFLANGALSRLQSSFRTAQLLIRLGHTFEAAALCRIILEQIAWAYSVHEIKDETALKVSPSKAITKLKNLFPNVGNKYGFLNKFTHIDPSLVSQYLLVKGDGEFSIVLSSTDEKVSWGVFLLALADLYSVVYEYVFRNAIMDFSRIERISDNKFIPLETRPLNRVLGKYYRLLSDTDAS